MKCTFYDILWFKANRIKIIKKKINRGFTLIELLTVVFVILLLTTVGMANYFYFYQKTDLDKTANEIISALELAQSKTLASESASQYGLHFESDKYVLFAGNIYAESDPNNKKFVLSGHTEISVINLAEGKQDVIFKRISGQTDQSGTIELRNITDTSQTKMITIFSSGRAEIEVSNTAHCPTCRITDTRHLNLNLGWSIQGYTTLTLYSNDIAPVSTNIAMSDYFNSDQSEFDWSGTINVNGDSEPLIIHTTFLDATNTILSIHRDRDRNNKPLEILIDALDIISYAPDGKTTIETYGGTAETQ